MTNKEDQDLTIFLNKNNKKSEKHPDWRMSRKDEASDSWDNLAVAWQGTNKEGKEYLKIGLSIALIKELYSKLSPAHRLYGQNEKAPAPAPLNPAPQAFQPMANINLGGGDYVNPDDLPF